MASDAARSVHPADVRVEALIDEELPPGHGAICIQPFFAHHLQLGPEIERRVRIDQQQRVALGCVRRRDGHAV